MRSLTQWLEYIESVHHRSIDLGLDRVAVVARALRLLPVGHLTITVAGTNGKGSSVALAARILIEAGYATGCYTSPHLVDFRERIQINDQWIPEQALCTAFTEIESARGDVPLTYFEFGTLAALWWFRRRQVDIAVLETGMGGRLDAVNIVDADVALITSIDIDHSQWLGPDREVIAVEKAGIMRTNRPAVCSDPEPPASLLRVAAERDVPLYCLQRDYGHQVTAGRWLWWTRAGRRQLRLPLPPLPQAPQLDNAAGVLMALDLLAGELPVSEKALCNGVATARAPGRGEELPGPPPVVLDVAHNVAAVRLLRDRLITARQPGATRAVFGVLGDKSVTELVALMAPVVDAWYLCTLDSPRAVPVAELHETVTRVCPGVPVVSRNDPVGAFLAAREACEQGDRICAFGSFYLVGAILAQRERLGL